MTKRILIATVLMCLATGIHAQDSGQGQSIMFDSQPHSDNYLTTLPESQKKKTRGERCTDMAQEMEQLKGRPQRRSAVADRYRKECELPY